MEKIIRKGIAFESKQLNEFDKLIKKRGYKNRSEAIRDIIRKELIEENISSPEKQMIASLTIVFDHHKHDLQHKLTHKQHETNLIKSTLHIHLNHHDCMEVLILDGKVKDIKKFSDEMLATKGVKHGKLVFTGT
ncbi:MAG: nickel-responsive transcriptional regulator NikR [Nanoarchaeota archaeon]